jgi:hypothetical protein
VQPREYLQPTAGLGVEALDGEPKILEPMLRHGRLAADGCKKVHAGRLPMCVSWGWTARGPVVLYRLPESGRSLFEESGRVLPAIKWTTEQRVLRPRRAGVVKPILVIALQVESMWLATSSGDWRADVPNRELHAEEWRVSLLMC